MKLLPNPVIPIEKTALKKLKKHSDVHSSVKLSLFSVHLYFLKSFINHCGCLIFVSSDVCHGCFILFGSRLGCSEK